MLHPEILQAGFMIVFISDNKEWQNEVTFDSQGRPYAVTARFMRAFAAWLVERGTITQERAAAGVEAFIEESERAN